LGFLNEDSEFSGAEEISLVPILWETGVGSYVMKPIAAPLVGGMVTPTIHMLIVVCPFSSL
jgi:Cu(I)/Ag(I) efflux system membrane protein CusA/SilA